MEHINVPAMDLESFKTVLTEKMGKISCLDCEYSYRNEDTVLTCKKGHMTMVKPQNCYDGKKKYTSKGWLEIYKEPENKRGTIKATKLIRKSDIGMRSIKKNAKV